MEADKHPELYCSLCEDLLLTPPIMLTSEGRNICGKCRFNCEDSLMENVWYELLARQFYFACKYAAEGCVEKLSFDAVDDHQRKCPYQVMKCPLESCACFGTTADMIIHWYRNHSLLKLEHDTFEVKITGNSKNCYMLPVKGLHFLIDCVHEKSRLILKVQSLNLLLLNSDVTFTFNASMSSGKHISQHVLKLKQVAEIDTRNLQEHHTLSFSVDVEIAPSIIKAILQQQNKMKCPCCAIQMAFPILKCPKGHLTCLDCTLADYDFCGQCINYEMYFKRTHSLDHLVVSSVFRCRWDGCEVVCNHKDIRSHEQSCCKRRFMCLHCYEWYGIYDDIVRHDKECPSKQSLCPVATDTKFTVSEIRAVVNCILLAFKEMFMLTFEPFDGNVCVRVSNFGPVSCFPWYKYEVDLHHKDDPNSEFNKTLPIRDKSHNEYYIVVPYADIINFGGVEYCKITLRVILLTGAERNRSVESNLRRFNV